MDVDNLLLLVVTLACEVVHSREHGRVHPVSENEGLLRVD
jgi:hypothetical protein